MLPDRVSKKKQQKVKTSETKRFSRHFLHQNDVRKRDQPLRFKSFTTIKQTTKFSKNVNSKLYHIENSQKMLIPSYIILRIQRLEGKQRKSR